MRSFVFCLVLAGCAMAQIPRDVLFYQARTKMLENLENQPNYTCLETVERMRQAPGGASTVQDTLRLEVALVNGKELFAWPGAKEFEDKDIDEIVSTGMFGNGNYGMYVRMIFGTGGLRFESKGPTSLGGRMLERYDFAVKKEISGYWIRVQKSKALVGYHGSLFVDPANADLRRLEVIADDIPAELGLTAAEDRIDYARSVIGDEEFLLPVESALLMSGSDLVSRNHTRFSGCRKFSGESTLILDDAEFAEALVEAPEVKEVQLPADALLLLELRTALKPRAAAVGDSVEAKLISDVKRGKEKVVPKGAIANGRILRLEISRQGATLAIQFYDLEWPGGHADVKAVFERRAGLGVISMRTLNAEPGTFILPEPLPPNLKGEVFYYRTVR